MKEITGKNNFCRVFELPNEYPKGFCFGGGHQVLFLIVDWFNPVNPMDMPAFGGTIKPWEYYVKALK